MSSDFHGVHLDANLHQWMEVEGKARHRGKIPQEPEAMSEHTFLLSWNGVQEDQVRAKLPVESKAEQVKETSR